MVKIRPDPATIRTIEIDLLLEGIYRVYGYDFRQYARGSIERRLAHRMQAERLESMSQLQHLVLHDQPAMQRLLQDISISVTEMFRDPGFFRVLRTAVLPELKSLSNIRIWHAGCSTGEEVYSMAIMLREEGLEDKATLYATDMNRQSLERAQTGVFPLSRMKLYTQNYIHAGGRLPFSDYYSIEDDKVIFDPTLRRRIVFAHHNLATDHSLNEFHFILCRNVLIYFDTPLQRRVFKLFQESLVSNGILALGSKEAILNQKDWPEIDAEHRIYRNHRMKHNDDRGHPSDAARYGRNIDGR